MQVRALFLVADVSWVADTDPLPAALAAAASLAVLPPAFVSVRAAPIRYRYPIRYQKHAPDQGGSGSSGSSGSQRGKGRSPDADDREQRIDGSARARYSHITPEMRRDLMEGLTRMWLAALEVRRRMSPGSPVAVLDALLKEPQQ
ncbi:hypothetical protein DR950_23925 [Kitasatospora xanthocidica]|uniref:Uncharacterized protein n=1 Tax=Kitasatospora xanthocidica TaxID=83382 RepID=A0A372ZX68_9ACTN|nr:hypothetical protein [Kitasatospora xanthocidica]RGD60429.1 hypothetical protein DR950_23925 [Kitasatospora xanthocidica]